MVHMVYRGITEQYTCTHTQCTRAMAYTSIAASKFGWVTLSRCSGAGLWHNVLLHCHLYTLHWDWDRSTHGICEAGQYTHHYVVYVKQVSTHIIMRYMWSRSHFICGTGEYIHIYIVSAGQHTHIILYIVKQVNIMWYPCVWELHRIFSSLSLSLSHCPPTQQRRIELAKDFKSRRSSVRPYSTP